MLKREYGDRWSGSSVNTLEKKYNLRPAIEFYSQSPSFSISSGAFMPGIGSNNGSETTI